MNRKKLVMRDEKDGSNTKNSFITAKKRANIIHKSPLKKKRESSSRQALFPMQKLQASLLSLSIKKAGMKCFFRSVFFFFVIIL